MFIENCRDWLTGVGVDYLVNTGCGRGQEPPRPWAFLSYHSLIEASTTAWGEGKGWSTHRAATFPHPHHGLANPKASERRGWSPTVLWVEKEYTSVPTLVIPFSFWRNRCHWFIPLTCDLLLRRQKDSRPLQGLVHTAWTGKGHF